MINYIRQHWMGENSLVWAFWINGVVVSAIASLVLSVFIGLFSAMLSGTTSLPIYLFTVIAGLWIIAVWSVVGIWRSASLLVENSAGVVPRKSAFWAYSAKLTIFIGVLNLVLVSIQILGPEIQLLIRPE